MRILYVGALGPHDTSAHRRDAMQRLGHEVVSLDASPYYIEGGSLAAAIRLRTLVGSAVSHYNRDVLATAAGCRPDVLWCDKPLYLWPKTVRAIRSLGTYTAHFTIDNPFGPRRDPGWRHIRSAISAFDLNLVQRDVNIADFREAGASDVRLMRTAYEPTIHFPPPPSWSDADRDLDVVYIGAPYDRRPEFILNLWREFGIPVRIWGSPKWDSSLPPDAKRALWQGRELWNAEYRQAFWRAKICLAFVTHSNCDDVAHKSFEIAASGGFLLAEDTPQHRAHFEAGQEAVFFSRVEECAELIRRYLPDESARARISAAGARRAVSGGYGNDARIARVFEHIQSTRSRLSGAPVTPIFET